jgi:hypothetical protein
MPPTRLVYTQCKLCLTLSEENKAKLRENTSAISSERKKLAVKLGIVAGQKDSILRHLVSCDKVNVDVKLFANAKLTEDKAIRFSA